MMMMMISFHFNSFKDGCPSAGAELQGALHLKNSLYSNDEIKYSGI